MARLPLTLRAIVLVPLLAAGVDVARATVACGTNADSCLEAAGQGRLGAYGSVLLVLYAAGLAFAVAVIARGRAVGARPPGFAVLWSIGTAGVAAVCFGQALLAAALGDGAALGAGWAELLAFCAVAGAVLALALRIAPVADELVRALRPGAPRLAFASLSARRIDAALARRPRAPFALPARGRGPPFSLA